MLADYKFLKTITVLGIGRVDIYLQVEEDDLEIDMYEEQDKKDIEKRLNRGDIWAWAFVQVLAMPENITEVFGTAAMGACSYDDEEQLLSCDCYSDMESLAIENLSDKLKDLKERLAQLE